MLLMNYSDESVANFFTVSKAINSQLAIGGKVQRLMFTNYLVGNVLYYQV